jgi:putative endonuclease
MKHSYVYILASKPYGAIYIGVTSNLIKRIYQHRTAEAAGHTKQYHIKRLVWYESHEDISEAILREKRLKKWKRNMKIDLIERTNPHWEDLWHHITT